MAKIWAYEENVIWGDSVIKSLLPFFSIRWLKDSAFLHSSIINQAGREDLFLLIDHGFIPVPQLLECLSHRPKSAHPWVILSEQSETYQDVFNKFEIPFICFNYKTPTVELISKIQEILDQNEHSSQKTMKTYQNIEIDFEHFYFKTIPDGDKVNLSIKEAKILRSLVDNCKHYLSRSEIQSLVWDGDSVSPRTIDSHISRLRKKLKITGIQIENKYGNGYLIY